MLRRIIEAMDVEKTVQFLLEQQAVFTSQMGELRTIVHDMAVDQVALGKAQARSDANMLDFQGRMLDLQGSMRDLQGTMGDLQSNMRDLQGTVRDLQGTMLDLQGAMGDLQGAMGDLQEQQKQTAETVQRLGVRVDRLVQALENRFGANGSAA